MPGEPLQPEEPEQRELRGASALARHPRSLHAGDEPARLAAQTPIRVCPEAVEVRTDEVDQLW